MNPKRRILFQHKLLTYFWFISFLAFLGSAYFYKITLNSVFQKEAIKDAERKLNLTTYLLKNHPSFESKKDFDDWIKSIALILGVRITYIDQDGKVIADSEVPFEKIDQLENHGNRKEVIEAKRASLGISIRESATIKRRLIYVAKTYTSSHVPIIPDGIIRVSFPEIIAEGETQKILPQFLLVLFGSFVITAILAYWLTRNMENSIETIINFARQIAEGQYKKRLSIPSKFEFPELAECINLIANSIDHHLEFISKTSQEFEIILDEMREGVLLLDKNLKILRANKFMEQNILKTTKYLGRHPIEVFPVPHFQEKCEEVHRVGIKYLKFPVTVIESGKSYDITISRIEKDGQFYGLVAVFHDISEIKRLDKMRKDFIANVSHELRTPLSSIKGYAETLLESINNPEMREQNVKFIETILKNANYMIELVQKLLELVKLESGEIRKEDFKPLDIIGIAEEAWEMFIPTAKQKGIELIRDIKTQNSTVRGIESDLYKVFQNLFDNAIRYQPMKTPLRLIVEETEDGKIMVCLEDKGPGIDAIHQERIFERFYRIEPTRTKKTLSTGLGLAICKHIIKNHGGDIWVESAPGKGAKFCFSLPKERN